MFKKSFTAMLLFLMTTGCSQSIMYSHKDGTDWLTKESRGNNLEDYATLKKYGENMCADQGKKLGVEVIYSAPGGSMNGNNFASYTVAYKCKEEEKTTKVVESAKEWFNKAADKLRELEPK